MVGFVIFLLSVWITIYFSWNAPICVDFPPAVDHTPAQLDRPIVDSVNMIAATRGYALRAFGFPGELRVKIFFDTSSCRDVIHAQFSDLARRDQRGKTAFIEESPMIPYNVEGFASGISIETNWMLNRSSTFRQNDQISSSERVDFQAVSSASESVILGMPTIDRLRAGMDYEEEYIYVSQIGVRLRHFYPSSPSRREGRILRIGKETTIDEKGGISVLHAPEAVQNLGAKAWIEPVRDDILVEENLVPIGDLSDIPENKIRIRLFAGAKPAPGSIPNDFGLAYGDAVAVLRGVIDSDMEAT